MCVYIFGEKHGKRIQGVGSVMFEERETCLGEHKQNPK